MRKIEMDDSPATEAQTVLILRLRRPGGDALDIMPEFFAHELATMGLGMDALPELLRRLAGNIEEALKEKR